MSAVKKRENRILFNYLDRASTVLVTIKADHTVQMINKKGCEILGHEYEEILEKDWFKNFIPQSERKELAYFFDQIIRCDIKAPEVYENTIVCQGNNRKLIRWNNTLLKDHTNQIIGMVSSGVDITDQSMVERRLRISDARYKLILQALPDTLVLYDVKGTFLDIQTAEESRNIFPKKETIGKNVRDLIPDKDECDNILRTLAKVDRTKKMEIIETKISSPEKVIHFEARVVPFEKEILLVILRDITLSKDFEDVLHVRNRALESAGNGIVIVDAQQPRLPIIYCNRAFTEITGYSKEEVIGINCQFLQNDDRDQQAIENIARAIQKGKPCREVLRNYRKNGTLFWNEINITPLYNDQNELTHFIGVQNDVTESRDNRKRLEEYAETLELKIKERTNKLHEVVQRLLVTNLSLKNQIISTQKAQEKAQTSQAMFSAIAHNFPKGIIIVFNSDYEMVYVDGEELERLALNKSDFEGADIDEVPFFSKLQKVRVKEDVTKTLKGTAISREVYFLGQIYTVNSTPLYSEQNKIVWALFVYINITEQKQIQQKLEMTLKAEQELNDLKSRFISMASHEFRTPLSAILSSAILIGKQNGFGKEETRIKHVSRIRNNVKSLVVILNDFLSLDMLEERKIRVNPNRFDLVQFSKSLIEEMEGQKQDGQEIVLKEPKINIMVYTDAKLLSHILINLLSNAMKYSKEGQVITMKISFTSKQAVITVTDQGIGIPQAEQKKLFERFFRAGNAVNIQGTGLGLNIVKQYTDLLRGTISFKSKIDVGTSFILKLPLNYAVG